MAKSIIDLPRGLPQNAKGWLDVFAKINKFLRVSGDELVIGGDIQLPEQSVGTTELENLAVTDEKLRQSQARSVIGRSLDSAGQPTDIQSTTNGHYLRQAGGVLSFGAIADADLPSTIARDSEVATAVSNHESAPDPHPQYTTSSELSTAITNHEAAVDPHPGYARESAGVFTAPVVMPSYTVATLPSAAAYARGWLYVSDETGGAVPAFSDGTNWRRCTDRNIVS
jgi:hypothetical protein